MPSHNHALAEPVEVAALYPHVQRATFLPELTYETMSPLGKERCDLSVEYEASGEKLLDEEKVASRKGGYGLVH